MNFRRKKPRRQPKCRLCTPNRWGNTKKFGQRRRDVRNDVRAREQ